jgi:ubiquinone/menaquinone biosynthesis C-methylase UbiE
VSKHLVDGLSDKAKANLDLTAADFSDSMIEFVTPRVKAFDIKSAEAVKADAADTKFPSDKFTHILLNFGPMIFTDGQAGLDELYRLLRPGGTMAMSSWKKVGWVEDVRAGFASDPEIPPFPPYEEFRKLINSGGDWDDSQWIKDNLTKTGFVDVEAVELSSNTASSSVDEFSRMMAGMVGMIQGRLWTQEQREKYGARTNDAVLAYMRSKYPDGEIKWDWTAIIATAKKAA